MEENLLTEHAGSRFYTSQEREFFCFLFPFPSGPWRRCCPQWLQAYWAALSALFHKKQAGVVDSDSGPAVG